MATIPADALDVLRRSTVTANTLTLPEHLDRTLYTAIAKVIEAMGGKWRRAAKLHQFRSGTSAIAAALADDKGDYIDHAKDFGFYPTPPGITARMITAAEIAPHSLILEPSAGEGDILAQLSRSGLSDYARAIDAVEIDPGRARILRTMRDAQRWPLSVLCADFLTVEPEPVYDVVIMNPPFARDQDAKHIRHAWGFLRPGGRLVSVAGAGLATRQHGAGAWVHDTVAETNFSSITPLPDGPFKSSGTDVRTVLVKLTKPV